MITVIGVVMFLCLNLCIVPQIWKTYRTKEVAGLSWSAYVLSLLGFMLALVYCWLTDAGVWILINYAVTTVLTVVEMILIWKYSR
ncbi:MAG: PQ-loop repeat-containing protein [Nitrosomonadaceae bacterium]|nr:PQ-loop repeat-containing protein [Nitrosomonadaceae bacterium]